MKNQTNPAIGSSWEDLQSTLCYVDTFEEEEVEPLTEIVAKINQTNATIESQTASLLDMLGQLHGTTKEADEELKAFVEAFKG